MKLALLIVAVALFIISVLAVVKEKYEKEVITGSVLGFVLLAVAYNYFVGIGTDTMQKIVYAYEHNKTLQCDEMQVNKQEFSYDYATQSFVGRGEFKGKVISIDTCEVQ